ncbi:uncharacterized protein LOC105277263 [Ooceraea biroi]|uniref:uncharacterized protein LOC105277263 n=1 Tax=Ooceraea biroi TaxID=2015173 RepID=UPI0005B8A0EE|nr:uncharacterized protein LOC105277263 [Ooceraea biroi]
MTSSCAFQTIAVFRNARLSWSLFYRRNRWHMSSNVGVAGNANHDCLVSFDGVVALEFGNQSNDTDLLIPAQDIKAHWKEKMFSDLDYYVRREGRSKGMKYCDIFYSNTRKPWFHDVQLDRRQIVIINRLRSGHTSLNQSLFNHHIVESPLCLCNDCNQTANHVCWQCFLFDDERQQLLRELKRRTIKIAV